MADEDVAAELALGSVFAGCRVEEVLGRGEMGIVYRAVELALQRPVALKLIRPEHSRDARYRERFRRESRLAASIDHPNVIPIFDAGDEHGVLYIMMRLVEGTDLRALIAAEGGLDPLRSARIVRQVGAALDAAHARGLLHRDVKPANVLLARNDHVYLSDFGLAKRESAPGGLTRQQSIIARATYLAPEQITNERVDARADVYALGCLLFEALTGEPPFGAGRGAGLLAQLDSPPPSPVERRPELPRQFDEVVRRAMARDPGERYQSADDLGQAALVAAGGLRRARPESVVARGLAAPGDGELEPSEPWRADEQAEAAEAGPGARAGRPEGGSNALRVAALGFLAILAVGMIAALRALATLGPDPIAEPTVRVGGSPAALAVSPGALWVANAADGTLARINPASRSVGRRAIRVGPGPAALAAAGGALWVADADDSTVRRLNAVSGRVTGGPIRVGGQPLGIVATRNAVWVTNSADDTVSRIDPASDEVLGSPIRVGDQPLGIAADSSAVWVANSRGRSLTRIRAGRALADPPIPLRSAPAAVAVGAGAVWVTSADRGTLTPIVAKGRRITVGRDIRVGTTPVAVTVANASVWVADAAEGAVKRIDPRTRKVVATTDVGRWPSGIAAADGLIWVANSIDGTVTPITP